MSINREKLKNFLEVLDYIRSFGTDGKVIVSMDDDKLTFEVPCTALSSYENLVQGKISFIVDQEVLFIGNDETNVDRVYTGIINLKKLFETEDL